MNSLAECVRTYPEMKDIPPAVCQDCKVRKHVSTDKTPCCVWGNDRLRREGFDL